MLPIKLAVLLFCCISFSPAEELEAKPTDAKVEAVETTKLTPSVEESKSKTEKRDSSDQTGTVFISNPTKETAFRPIYPAATYYAAPAESDAIFEPTTVRYTAADAAAAAAPQQQQQAFYGKSEGGSIRFGEQRHGAVRSSLPGPLRLSQHQQQQQQHQQHHAAPPHRFSYAVQPQVELYQRPIAKQHAPIYNYVEAEPSMYERLAPQQYQLGGVSTAAAAAASLPGHRVQYIIAIPLSYMRQLQQQLGGNLLQVPSSPAPSSSSSSTTTSTTSTTTSTAAPPSTPESAIASASHPIVQLLGPLARDQPSVYHRHQYYPAEGPTAASPYAQQYLQIPASVLLAASQQLQQHHQQHQQQQQQQQQQPQTYAKVAPTTSPVYQPFIYQSQPQFQLPRLYPAAPMIYTEQPVGQQTTLYAYPLAPQHHQPLQQQQHHHHQQQQPARLVRLGPKHGQQQHKYAAVPLAATASSVSSAPVATATATTTTATAATLVLPTATTATHEAVQQQQQQQQQQPHHSLPIVHYNPIYVQAPPEQQQQQQQQQQQHQFAILPRFSNNNPKAGYNLAHESTPPIHVVRLSAANALGQHQQPIHHYHHYQPAMAQQQQQQHPHLYQPHALPVGNYIEEQPQQQHQQHQQQQPALIPYFSHPGAVHYGTHLYHPASVAAVSAAAGTKQLQQQQPQQQHQQRQASETTATSGRLPGDSGVKQPTAATNIVKYP